MNYKDGRYKDRKEYHRKYYHDHCVHIRELIAQNKRDNPERVKEEHKRNWSRKRKYARAWLNKLRVEVLTYYGNGKCSCLQCGFSDIRALTLDHINNNGADDRRGKWGKFINGGTSLYARLKKEGYPMGYQTLCYNCNLIKYREYRESQWIVAPLKIRG